MKLNSLLVATVIVGTVLSGGPVSASGKDIPVVPCRVTLSEVHQVDCKRVQPIEKLQIDVREKRISAVSTLPRALSCFRLASSRTDNLPEKIRELVHRVAEYLKLSPRLLEAVALAESGGDQGAVSRAGAIGVMQLMPGTARGLGVNPWDLEQNVLGGSLYLKRQLDRYGSIPLALAAYNAGPRAVEKYNGIPPYKETHQYITRVLSIMGRDGA